MVWRLAWRNVWRNSRRTAVVVAAVAIGISGVLTSMAVNYGMVVQMVEVAIATELGHLQIHGIGFDSSPDLAIRLADGGEREVRAIQGGEGVRAYARRVRGEGLLTSPRASAGVSVVGVEPEREAEVSRIAGSIVGGEYLDGVRRRVLLGEILARRLSVDVGDKVVLSVQDLAGDLNGEALRIGGIFRTSSSQLDRGTVFVRLDEGQALLGLGADVSEVVVVVGDRDAVPALRTALSEALPGAEVRSWDELRPVLLYMVESFDQVAGVAYVAVFVAMAFGIANVLLMAVYERIREIGILMAVGMQRRRLVSMIIAEAMLVTLVGMLLGFALALLAVAALADGIDLSRWGEGLNSFGVGTRIVPVLRGRDFATPALVAVVTALLASAWPAWRAVRFRPAEAMRQA